MIKKFAISFLVLGLFLAPQLVTVNVLALQAPLTNTGIVNCGAGGAIDVNPSTCTSTDPNAGSTVNNITTLAINMFSIFVGLVCVVMIIIGGLKYVTSGGDSGNVSGAKNTILYAVVGLIIVALAQIIVKFVLNKASTGGA